MLSDLFKDELKVGKVNVQVQGGNQEEWVATALAVAYEEGFPPAYVRHALQANWQRWRLDAAT